MVFSDRSETLLSARFMLIKLDSLARIVAVLLFLLPVEVLPDEDTDRKQGSKSSLIVLEPRVILRDSSAQRTIFSSPDNAEQELQVFLRDNLQNLLQSQAGIVDHAVKENLNEALYFDILNTLSSPPELVVGDKNVITYESKLKSKRNLSALKKTRADFVLFTAFDNQATENARWFKGTNNQVVQLARIITRTSSKDIASKRDALFVVCLINAASGEIVWSSRGLVPFSKILTHFKKSEEISRSRLASVLAFEHLIK